MYRLRVAGPTGEADYVAVGRSLVEACAAAETALKGLGGGREILGAERIGDLLGQSRRPGA